MPQAILRELVLLKFIMDRFETQAICEKAVEVKGWKLSFVPDQYKMQEMCVTMPYRKAYDFLHDVLKTALPGFHSIAIERILINKA